MHADVLKELAANAQRLTGEEELERARADWHRALELLPPTSQQARIVQSRIDDLTKRLNGGSIAPKEAADGAKTWWRQGLSVLVVVLLFSVGKLKFLLLGLTKASTFFSMFAFFGVYWSLFGWPLAAGLVISIYIHEMGHVHMLRRLGIAAGAPLFIPGLGALVMLKQRPADAITDAKIGLAGPVWGFGAGLAAYMVFLATDVPVWAAIAQITGYINLFNLIPIWQLDGSRGFHALTSVQRWAAVVALGALYFLTLEKLVVLVAIVAIYRAFQRTEGEGHSNVLLAYVALAAGHSLLASIQAVAGLP